MRIPSTPNVFACKLEPDLDDRYLAFLSFLFGLLMITYLTSRQAVSE